MTYSSLIKLVWAIFGLDFCLSTVNECLHIRDKFLICLLYETGMRIGEALGLRHEDMITGGKKEIYVKRRLDNYNNTIAK